MGDFLEACNGVSSSDSVSNVANARGAMASDGGRGSAFVVMYVVPINTNVLFTLSFLIYEGPAGNLVLVVVAVAPDSAVVGSNRVTLSGGYTVVV